MVTHMSIDSLQPLEIGHVSDNLTHRVEIDCGAWKRKYPALTDYFLYITEPNGLIYIADTKMDGSKLIWDVSRTDTAIRGLGSYQVTACGKYGDRKSSKTCTLGIRANMDGMDNADPPDPSKTWVEKVYAAAQRAEAAAARAAEAAESAIHQPIIGENGNWWLWDITTGEYLDSGFPSRGE